MSWPLDRRHQKGYITDPRGKAKSVVFIEVGLARAGHLLDQLFGKPAEGVAPASSPTRDE